MLRAHLPGFEVQDVTQALSCKTEEMFERLIAEPLKRMAPPLKPVLIVMALDGLPLHCLRPVLSLLTEVFKLLPSFFTVFVTVCFVSCLFSFFGSHFFFSVFVSILPFALPFGFYSLLLCLFV